MRLPDAYDCGSCTVIRWAQCTCVRSANCGIQAATPLRALLALAKGGKERPPTRIGGLLMTLGDYQARRVRALVAHSSELAALFCWHFCSRQAVTCVEVAGGVGFKAR